MSKQDKDELWNTDLENIDISDDHDFHPHGIDIVDEDVLTDWTIPAIASAVVCFPPTGIIAFLQARKAKTAAALGDSRLTAKYLWRTRFLVFLTCLLGIIMYGVIIALVQSIQHVDPNS